MKRLLSLVSSLLFVLPGLTAQDIERNIRERLSEYFLHYTAEAKIPTPKLDSCTVDYDHKRIRIYVSDAFGYQPFRPASVGKIYQEIQSLLPGPVHYYGMTVYTQGHPIEALIPNFYRPNKLQDKGRRTLHRPATDYPWTRNASRPYTVAEGLQNRHIALWQSHGRYYKNDKNEWGWQRPRLFCTTEDLFTQSYILPYVIPMLENAGAVVYTPRERDIQRQEVIVDNDTPSPSLYLEVNAKRRRWQDCATPGFAHRSQTYQEGENPFTDGSARFIATEKKKKKAKAFVEWIPTFPEKGRYAVYVSYQTLPQSVRDAEYLVFHTGGVTRFLVNQRMGGGTWTYLGTFEFDKGNSENGMVVLTNYSQENGVVCADAVRFGGGMGNVARNGILSGLPRYLEGARYAAQWNGLPYEVYGGRQGTNDYADDINTRSHALNYLAGGSVVHPDQPGLGIPLEMSLALHSDGIYQKEGQLVGSLGVYTTRFNEGRLADGTDRLASRDLTDLVMTQLQEDIEREFHQPWSRRSMWDRNYSETRLPAVPSTIIELLSHLNFPDMKLGHDPNFKFTASRAIYKGILRFMAHQHNEKYVVQPLPVSHFAVRFGKKKHTLELSWQGNEDPLEPSATPDRYIVYTRIGYGGFDNGTVVKKNSFTLPIEPGLLYSFKVAALNDGGESFPSEILSAYQARRENGRVLIVNGFDRLCGPAVIDTPEAAGFALQEEMGVPYLYNLSYCGAQQDFDRKQGGKEGEGALGHSGSELEGRCLAGNTFDYPFVHGKAIQACGNISFVSCSDEAVETGRIRLEDYPVVDYILGLEKEAPQNYRPYPTFSPTLQSMMSRYCQNGGNLLVSGAYLGSDLNRNDNNRRFAEQVLKCRYQGSLSNDSTVQVQGLQRLFQLPALPNETSYPVSRLETLTPVGAAFPVMVYLPGNLCAGVAYKGNYRTFVLSFPFESIPHKDDRSRLMNSILHFFREP